jgi:beta-glucosidase
MTGRIGVFAATLLPVLAAAAPPSADTRAAALVARMTIDEKLAVTSLATGSVLMRVPGEKRVGAGYMPAIPRLGIPALYETDASLGVANANEQRRGDVATALPSALATAASFDPEIARAGGAMIGGEARAKGFDVLLAGGANLIRDPWAGRSFEYFSEDPLLTGRMAGAAVAGVQSAGIVSTVKHFALNPQETGRTVMSADIDEAAFRMSDLLAFHIAIERGRPGAVMCGYNRIAGDYACENRFLLTDMLKNEWRYPGWVMSDWGAVHSTAKSVNAGLDQQSGRELDPQPYLGKPLADAVAKGEIAPARLDDMVRRVLRSMIAVGLLERPPPATPQPIDYPADAAVAQRAAEAGMVLLKNRDAVLPLAPDRPQRILLVGGHADDGVLSGGGSSQVRPVGGVARTESLPHDNPFNGYIKRIWGASSPLAAIRARAPGATVDYTDGHDRKALAAAAAKADVVIVFALQWRSEAMDLPDLALPNDQDDLIATAAAVNPRTVVVLETGGAVAMPWLDRVGAAIEAWYPGERGGPAIAATLFGDNDPGGRLPVTFPRDAGQAPRAAPPEYTKAEVHLRDLALKPPPPGTIPDMSGGLPLFSVDYKEGADTGYRWYELQGATPLFAFGYGLSYTRFAYAHFTATGGATVRARVTVTNVGARAGADVPQLYVAVPGASGPPIRRLVGFERVVLAPGESRTVTMTADPRLLAEWDGTRHGWHVRGGPATVTLARSATDAAATAQIGLVDRRF